MKVNGKPVYLDMSKVNGQATTNVVNAFPNEATLLFDDKGEYVLLTITEEKKPETKIGFNREGS